MQPTAASPRPGVRSSPRPWLLAVVGVVAGLMLISLAGYLTGDGSGPLRPLASASAESWARIDESSPAAVAVRLERFSHESFTRTGARWHVDASALVTDSQGVRLLEPSLELRRGGSVAVRLRAGEARLRPGRALLFMSGGAVLEVGDDLRVESSALEFLPGGGIRTSDAVRVKTPQGRTRGTGILVEPSTGRVTLSPGEPGQELLRWSGWGQGLVDLGEAVRNWSQTVLPRPVRGDAPADLAGDAAP